MVGAEDCLRAVREGSDRVRQSQRQNYGRDPRRACTISHEVRAFRGQDWQEASEVGGLRDISTVMAEVWTSTTTTPADVQTKHSSTSSRAKGCAAIINRARESGARLVQKDQVAVSEGR